MGERGGYRQLAPQVNKIWMVEEVGLSSSKKPFRFRVFFRIETKLNVFFFLATTKLHTNNDKKLILIKSDKPLLLYGILFIFP
jgi:hypothetical protein